MNTAPHFSLGVKLANALVVTAPTAPNFVANLQPPHKRPLLQPDEQRVQLGAVGGFMAMTTLRLLTSVSQPLAQLRVPFDEAHPASACLQRTTRTKTAATG